VTPAESPLPVPEQASAVTGDPSRIAALQTHIEHFVAQNALLASERAALLARVAELERRLGLNRAWFKWGSHARPGWRWLSGWWHA